MIYHVLLYLVTLYSQNYAANNLQIISNTPQKSFLRSSHPKNHLPNFSESKKSRNQKFPAQKILPLSLSLEIRIPPQPHKGSNFKALTGKIWVV